MASANGLTLWEYIHVYTNSEYGEEGIWGLSTSLPVYQTNRLVDQSVLSDEGYLYPVATRVLSTCGLVAGRKANRPQTRQNRTINALEIGNRISSTVLWNKSPGLGQARNFSEKAMVVLNNLQQYPLDRERKTTLQDVYWCTFYFESERLLFFE